MKEAKINNKGVRFFVTREIIQEYLRMPPDVRLAWLEEACIFSYQGLDAKRRHIWEKFRKGEI